MQVMGILNLTPDSFYAASRAQNEAEIAARVEAMISEGVDIIDVGAYSSRPGADDVSPQDETERMLRGLKTLRKISADIPVSIDTFRASVVQSAFDAIGEFIVNDISAGEMDDKMFATVGRLKLPYIAMHCKGTPQTMQTQTNYSNLIDEIKAYFSQKIEQLHAAGVRQIIIDPGFGFAKTLEQNYNLLANLGELHIFNLPLLVGFSRKSMLYKLLNVSPNEALNATTVVNTIALMQGVEYLRVHDVKEAVETIKIIKEIKRIKNNISISKH